MEWDEGDLMILWAKALQLQVCDIGERIDPTAYIHVGGSNDRKTVNGETVGVASGGAGRIRKGLLPLFDGGMFGVEFDLSKKVFSRAWDS